MKKIINCFGHPINYRTDDGIVTINPERTIYIKRYNFINEENINKYKNIIKKYERKQLSYKEWIGKLLNPKEIQKEKGSNFCPDTCEITCNIIYNIFNIITTFKYYKIFFYNNWSWKKMKFKEMLEMKKGFSLEDFKTDNCSIVQNEIKFTSYYLISSEKCYNCSSEIQEERVIKIHEGLSDRFLCLNCLDVINVEDLFREREQLKVWIKKSDEYRKQSGLISKNFKSFLRKKGIIRVIEAYSKGRKVFPKKVVINGKEDDRNFVVFDISINVEYMRMDLNLSWRRRRANVKIDELHSLDFEYLMNKFIEVFPKIIDDKYVSLSL